MKSVKHKARKTLHLGIVAICTLLKTAILLMVGSGIAGSGVGIVILIYSKMSGALQSWPGIPLTVFIWFVCMVMLFALVDVIEKFHALPADIKKLWSDLNKFEREIEQDIEQIIEPTTVEEVKHDN